MKSPCPPGLEQVLHKGEQEKSLRTSEKGLDVRGHRAVQTKSTVRGGGRNETRQYQESMRVQSGWADGCRLLRL